MTCRCRRNTELELCAGDGVRDDLRSCSASSADPRGAVRVCRDAAAIRESFKLARSPPSSISRAPRRSTGTSTRWRCSTRRGCARSGLVWSRPNVFGHGVPFRFPRSPDTGPGLTDAGKELVRACNRLRDHDRPLAPEREGLLGRGRAQRRAAGGDALERPRALPAFAQPDRQAARRDPRESDGMVGRQLRRLLPARGRRQRCDTPLEIMVRAYRLPGRAARRSTASASARTSTAR